MERVFQSWASQASHLMGDCFDLTNPWIDTDASSLSPLVRFVSAQLDIACHLSSESVLLLVREGKEWDADIIARSVMEGSLKLVYLLHGDAAEMETKADEYWNLLPMFHSVRHSERARSMLDELPNPGHPQWNPFREVMLDQSTLEEIYSQHSRRERKQLEERWSFAGICRTLARSNDPDLNQLVHLAHGYGMSSHLLHMDGDGIGIIWDRFQRDPRRQDAARLGHAARLVSDVCAFAELRAAAVLRACGQATDRIQAVREGYRESLFEELRKASEHFSAVEYGS